MRASSKDLLHCIMEIGTGSKFYGWKVSCRCGKFSNDLIPFSNPGPIHKVYSIRGGGTMHPTASHRTGDLGRLIWGSGQLQLVGSRKDAVNANYWNSYAVCSIDGLAQDIMCVYLPNRYSTYVC